MTDRPIYRRVGPAAVAACVLVLPGAGCSSQTVPKGFPVSGKVVYKDTGEPVPRLTGGYVNLESTTDPKNMPVGEIEDGGVFFLGTIIDGTNVHGVLPGEYRVRIVLPEDPAVQRRARSMIDPRYTKFETSGLTLTITGKNDDVKIGVEKPKR